MKTLPYKTQAWIYAGIFLLLVIICMITCFLGGKKYRKQQIIGIILFVLSILSLAGAAYTGFNIIKSISMAKKVIQVPEDSNTRSDYFEIVGSNSQFNGENYDFKTNSRGSYILEIKGLKEGKIQLLTGKNNSFLKEFQTVNVEPGEITHVVLHLLPTQANLHLVLKDQDKTIDVINIKNQSRAYKRLSIRQNRMLPGQKINSSFVNSDLINKYNSAIHYTIDDGQKITKLEYYSKGILLAPEDIIFCLQNLTGNQNLQFSDKKLAKNNFKISFNKNFNFYNSKTERWYNVEQVMNKEGSKLNKFIVRVGKNRNYA